MEVIAENKHYAFADCWAWSNNRCELIEGTTAVDGNEPELDCTVYVTETVSGGMARENKYGIEFVPGGTLVQSLKFELSVKEQLLVGQIDPLWNT